ncbi:MAG: hypothetical protein IT259_04210 [Saprospiraceae bacterium]|nr:hypothetical protein [Saprospiraceae bacterium]
MKTITVIGLLLLAGFAILQLDLKADPSGRINLPPAELRDTSIHTGLMADPTGTAYLRAAQRQP